MNTIRRIVLIAVAVMVGISVPAAVRYRDVVVAYTATHPDKAPESPADVLPPQVVAKPVPADTSRPASAAKKAVQSPPVKEKAVADDDLMLLARMISAESSHQPYEGMVAVGAVILNRVRSTQFPKTIEEVIMQKGQFQPITNGWFWKTAVTDTHIKAAKDALSGTDPTNGALYFFVYEKVTSAWLWSRPHKITIGSHRFVA